MMKAGIIQEIVTIGNANAKPHSWAASQFMGFLLLS